MTTMQGNLLTPEVAHEVWVAEDGRCENCGRAMGEKAACFARQNQEADPPDFSPENLRLLCIDCKRRLPSPFANGLVLAPLLQDGLEAEEPEPGATAALGPMLGRELPKHGVIVWVGPSATRRWWWLPGVGSFLVQHSATFKPALVLQAQLQKGEREVRVKPQARTRGLPRGVR